MFLFQHSESTPESRPDPILDRLNSTAVVLAGSAVMALLGAGLANWLAIGPA